MSEVQTVLIELSSVCNCKCLSCPHSVYKQDTCGASFDRNLGFMDFNLFKHVVKDAWTVADTINFSFFGEPMLHPRFAECMDYLRSRPVGKRVVLFSNMTCATKTIFKTLIKMRLNRLKISMDAATSETFEKIRAGSYCLDLDGNRWKGDRFEMVCKKVEYWFGLKHHVPTRHEFVVSSRNSHELELFVNKWLPLLGKHDDILSKSILSYGGVMLNDDFLNKQPCRIWKKEHQMIIDWEGNVSPCNLDVNMQLKIGNVHSQTLKEIWKGEAYQRIRDASIKRSISPCDKCFDGNNRSRDIFYRKGDKWRSKNLRLYVKGDQCENGNSHSCS